MPTCGGCSPGVVPGVPRVASSPILPRRPRRPRRTRSRRRCRCALGVASTPCPSAASRVRLATLRYHVVRIRTQALPAANRLAVSEACSAWCCCSSGSFVTRARHRTDEWHRSGARARAGALGCQNGLSPVATAMLCMEGVIGYTCMPTPPLDRHANISRIMLYVKCSRPLASQARATTLH